MPSIPDDGSPNGENKSPGSDDKLKNKIRSITPIAVELEIPRENPKNEDQAPPPAVKNSEEEPAANKDEAPQPAQESAKDVESTPLSKIQGRRRSKMLDAIDKTQAAVSKWKVAKKAKVIGRMALQKKEILNKNYGIDESTADKMEAEENIKCLLPNSKSIIYWHRLMRLLTLYLVIVYVFRVCLLSFSKDFLFYIEIVMQACFLVDIIINFFLAYYERDELVTDLKSIVTHYCLTFFIFDLVAAVPVNAIALSIDFEPGNEDHRILRLLTAFRVVKFLISIAAYEGWKDIPFLAKRSPTIIRLIKILVLLIYFVHFSACIFVLLAKIDGSNRTWIFLNDNQDLSSLDLYTNAMYWATQTIVTVGFGDITINTNAERLMALILMYIGSAVYSFMISNLGAVVEEADTFETTLKAKINSFKTLAKETNLPEELVQKVKKFIESNHKHNPRTSMHDQSFINELPFTLKAQLMFNINAKVVESVPFLKDKDVDFILKMAPSLKPIELLPKEILFRENEYPEDVFFLTSGIIHLKGKTGVPLYVVSEGEMFGDIEVLQNIARITTAQAQTRCSLFSIEKETFTDILNSYQEVKDNLVNDAKDKKKRLIDLKKRSRDDTTTGAHIFTGSHFRSSAMNAADYANRMYEKPTDKFEREISTFLEKGVGKKWKMKYVKRMGKKSSKEHPLSIGNDSIGGADRELEFPDESERLTKRPDETGIELAYSQSNPVNMSRGDALFADDASAINDAELINKKKKEFEDQYFDQAEKLGDELLTTIDTLEECNNNMKKQESKYERLMMLIQAIEEKQNQINSRVEMYRKKIDSNGKTTSVSESINSNLNPNNDSK